MYCQMSGCGLTHSLTRSCSKLYGVLAAHIVTAPPMILSGSIALGRLIGNTVGVPESLQWAARLLMRSHHPILSYIFPGHSSLFWIAGKQPKYARSGFYITASISKQSRHLSNRYVSLAQYPATHPNYLWTGRFSTRVHSFDLDSTMAISLDGWEANTPIATETGKQLSRH
jgi:hypothetical protein